jgi:hypothetical protein
VVTVDVLAKFRMTSPWKRRMHGKHGATDTWRLDLDAPCDRLKARA